MVSLSRCRRADLQGTCAEWHHVAGDAEHTHTHASQGCKEGSGGGVSRCQHWGQRRFSLQQVALGTACDCQVSAAARRPAWAVHDVA